MGVHSNGGAVLRCCPIVGLWLAEICRLLSAHRNVQRSTHQKRTTCFKVSPHDYTKFSIRATLTTRRPSPLMCDASDAAVCPTMHDRTSTGREKVDTHGFSGSFYVGDLQALQSCNESMHTTCMSKKNVHVTT